MEKDKTKVEKQPVSTTKDKAKPIKKTNDDFKRRYFDFYDDIKISDRQDW
ncbi:MAG: hypothetical protein ACI4M6_01545 [Christensenellaceae bacterium]